MTHLTPLLFALVPTTGYSSATIANVSAGVGGCLPYVAPSTSDVTLEPVVDAGADGS